MNKDDRSLRDLQAENAAPLISEQEVELVAVKAELEKKLRIAFCRKCGVEMPNPSGLPATGLCIKCNPSSRVVEMTEGKITKQVTRMHRRSNKHARKIARRMKYN